MSSAIMDSLGGEFNSYKSEHLASKLYIRNAIAIIASTSQLTEVKYFNL